ncbi:MAG TPA: membrane protein insertion efficiency factor YidD [Candidatus Sulfotelmatobacter sp.]|jgi:putative membrane protein insertion efficiency factor|nr:membrane protein insertion efficiency factor YidD [Candidatus Sulfotelmatobacter sp.]
MSRILQRAVLQLLRAYKWAISPLLPPACRYVPTCSEYAMEAVERHGVLRGALMSAWRLLRCHPFAKGGYDPVPQSGTDRWQEAANDERPTTNSVTTNDLSLHRAH